MPWRPRLWFSHRNFFIIFFAMALVLHFGMGLSQVLDPARYDIESLASVQDVAPFETWGVLHLITWGLMTVGAYYRFDVYARIGLALGLVLCLARGLLIEVGAEHAGAGLLVWIPMAVQHYVMAAEPQENPLTSREPS